MVDKEWYAEFSRDHLTGTMLPNLRSMHSHIVNVTALAKSRVLSMKTLSRLHTGHGLHRNVVEDSIAEMIRSLEDLEGLPALKDFRFETRETLGGSAA